MLPHFDSNYGPNNQNLQYNGASVSAPQQVMGNQGNFRPNNVQIPPQFQAGMLNNPQFQAGMLNNPQFQAGMLNNPQLAMLNPNSYFAPAQIFPFPQGSFQSAANLPNMFAYNSVNQPQFFPNGLPNMVPNVNQLLQMQMPMPTCGPMNYGPSVNSQLGMNNGKSVTQQLGDGNGFQHTNCSTPLNKDFVSPQAQPSQNLHSPGTANSQSSGKVNGMNGGKNSWKSHNTNFMKDKQDASQQGFGRRQFQHGQRAHGNKFNNEFRGKGKQNYGMDNVNVSSCREDTQVEKKRPLVVNYTEKEIQQWREERRKYYPSKANVEKKLNVKAAQLEIIDEATKIRREQLKDILAKQAELGCEVAEIPSSYLSDSEQQMRGRQQNNRAFGRGRGGRFQNRFDMGGRFHQNNRFSKRQRTENPASSQNQHESFTKQRPTNGLPFDVHRDKKREPSLLKKLLSSDIKRDKKYLLQVFRFTVMNSFILDEPEKSLKFPAVTVKESDEDNMKLMEEDQQVVNGGISVSHGYC